MKHTHPRVVEEMVERIFGVVVASPPLMQMVSVDGSLMSPKLNIKA